MFPVKWILVGLMLLHGLIHLMGGVNELGWAKISGLSGKTLVPLPPVLHTVLGVVWLLVVILFVVAALGLMIGQPWWRTLLIPAVVVSQVMIIIWWPDAKAGTIANLLLLAGAGLLQ